MKGDLLTRLQPVIKVMLAGTLAYIVFCFDSSHFRGLEEQEDVTLLQKLGNRLYFTLTTFSTVGFGDISPKSTMCKIVSCAILMGILIQVLDLMPSQAS